MSNNQLNLVSMPKMTLVTWILQPMIFKFTNTVGSACLTSEAKQNTTVFNGRVLFLRDYHIYFCSGSI